jgi:YVTN family beta-propeller protein
VVKTIGVGSNPREIAITPDGSKAYAVNFSFGPGSLSVIRTSDDTVIKTISLGSTFGPAVIDITPDGKRAYVVESHNRIAVVDTDTDTVIDTITGLVVSSQHLLHRQV